MVGRADPDEPDSQKQVRVDIARFQAKGETPDGASIVLGQSYDGGTPPGTLRDATQSMPPRLENLLNVDLLVSIERSGALVRHHSANMMALRHDNLGYFPPQGDLYRLLGDVALVPPEGRGRAATIKELPAGLSG